MAEEAWALQYSDGSNNRLRVWLDGEAIRYDFSPTTPAQSSSGTYSGGRAAHGLLPDPHVAELWSRIQALAGHSEWHTPHRTMGSGAFIVAIGDDEQHFRVRPCKALADLDEWLRAALNLGRASHR